MPWFKVDDTFGLHPKVVRAGNAAIGLWVRAGAWCAQQLTDGKVPTFVLPMFGARPSEARKLVDAGLWEETSDGWIFKDWEQYQPSKQAVLANRRSASARQQVARSPELRKAVRDRDRDRCRYCGVRVSWTDRRGSLGGTYDHVVPDGPSDFENLVVCCRGCNSAKGRRDPGQAGMKLNPIQVGPRSDSEHRFRTDLGAS